jgi:hypothetical protein
MEQEILKRIVSNLRCEKCNGSFQPEEIVVLGRKDNLWYLAVSCSACSNQEVVAALVEEAGEPELPSDLNESERKTFVAPISSDDVLNVHMFLEDFDGNFHALFPGAEGSQPS